MPADATAPVLDAVLDTVVVGASQKAGHRIAGSVATKNIRAGHWPVLVVP